MFVYLITNVINGMRYVGQTKQSLAKRWIMHVNKNHCRYLHSAIHKYGRENFIIEPLFEVPTRELANQFEIEYISRYQTMCPNGYNILPGGDLRPPITEETRRKISEYHKGKKHRLGHHVSDETKKKLSIINSGKTLSLEHRQKIAKTHIGITHSIESRAKMSLARFGKKMSEITRQRMRLSQQARRLKELNV